MGTIDNVLVAAFVFAAVQSQSALATIPDANGVFHACYLKSGGTMRVIDNSVTTCRSTETAIAWNATGPQGPAGPAGSTGPAGPAGQTGATGPAGPGLDLAKAYVRKSANVTVGAGSQGAANSTCDPGDVAIAGEYGVNGVNFLVYFAGILTDPAKIGSTTDVASFYEFFVVNNNPAGGAGILIFSQATCAPPV
jgi:hypothetical protein